MRRFLRILAFVVLAGGVFLVVAKTDNPLSAIFQAREARRLGFLLPGDGAADADLPAFRAARDRCRVEARGLVEAGAEGCRLCATRDCLETEGARFRTMRGRGGDAAPGPGGPGPGGT